MATESDGINEMAEDMLRAMLLIGTRLAARHQQAKADALTQAARESQQALEQERARQSTAQHGAMGSLAGVGSDSWWDHADAEDIRHVWSTAREYQGEDPRADQAVYRIADELQDRYGFDVRDSDPGMLGDQPTLPTETTLSTDELIDYDQRASDRIDALGAEQENATPTRANEIESETLELTEIREMIAEDLADRRDHQGFEQAGQAIPRQTRRSERSELVTAELRTGTQTVGTAAAVTGAAYDSPERRGDLRERLKGAELPERAVEARVLTDMGQAMPASEAVTLGAGDRAQARPATRNPRGRAPSPQRGR